MTKAERAAIAARVAYGQLPWWRRLITKAPAGWHIRHPDGPFN